MTLCQFQPNIRTWSDSENINVNRLTYCQGIFGISNSISDEEEIAGPKLKRKEKRQVKKFV